MLGYLFSTGKYEEAANYVGIIENGINRRTGEIKAERTYNKWLEGSNEGLDLLWDNARAWGKGVVDGGYDYFDSFGDIIDPNATPTAKDYEIMRMQELLSQPVYKVGSRYYSSGQIDSAMASIGFHPMGSSPTDGYTNATEASIGFQYGEMEIMPENTLWDESVKTSYGIGFKVVENSVKAVTKAIHPVLGRAVDTAHSFGKARETAEQAAYMEQVDLSTSTLDGVDYEEFWKEQAPQLAKAGISIGGNYWQPLKDAGTLISVTKTCISVPSTLVGMVDTFTHDSKAPFHEWIYDIYRSYDTVAGIVSGATGGQINISTGSLLGNGAKSAWGDESKAAKFVSKTYGTLTSYGTQYGDAFSKR